MMVEMRRMRKTDDVTLDVLAQGHLIERTYVIPEEVKDVFVEYMRERGIGKQKGDAYLWSKAADGQTQWYLTIPGVER